jgi:alcohol dehydrogenase
MRAIVFDGQLRYAENYPAPEPKPGEALIKVRMAGICNTDLEIMKGYLGFTGVLGHEFVGIVEKVAGEAGRWIGKRVVGDINCGCGICPSCLSGWKGHCPNRVTLGISGKDGALADHVTLPLVNLFQVPEGIKDEEAVLVEPLAAAFEILEQIQIHPTDRILVLGDGKLGILVSLVLKLSQADVTLAGKHEEKLRVARGQGVETVLSEQGTPARIYDVVVDATGRAEGLEIALECVKPRGTIVLKSTVAERKEMNLSRIVIDEITVVGSRCGPFEPALRALANKSVNVKPLISAVFAPNKAHEAFAKATGKGSLKVLIDFT